MEDVEKLSQSERMRLSNKEAWTQWAVDVTKSPYDLPLESLNPGHPMLFEADASLAYFERLRKEDPVHRCENSQFGPYWSVTRYQDIMAVDTNHRVFSSDSRKGGIQLGGVADPDPDPTFHLPMFIMEDQPKHDEQRKVVAPMFTQRELARLEGLIRERAVAILENLPVGETFNWVRHVSVELTGQMLATLFDVPQEDRHKLIHWSDVSQSIGDPDVFETPEMGFAELWKCWEYFDAVWKERAARNQPGSDLISMLVHGEATKNMPPNEYLGNVLLLIVGGNDTTRNSISGGRAGPESLSRRIRQAQGQPWSGAGHDPGDHPLSVPGRPHGANGAGGYGARRQADQGRRQAGNVVCLRQPGRQPV